MQADLAHDFEAVLGEVLAKFIKGYACARLHSLVEACARDDTSRRGVFPFLDAFGIAEDDGCYIQPFHFSDHVLDVFALGGRIELWGAFLLAPAERSLLGAGIGGEKLRLVGTHGPAGKGFVHGMDVNVNDRRHG